MTARKPSTRRGDDAFAKMTRGFERDMENCTLGEIGLMSLLITSRAITPVGVVYRRHEWAQLPGSSDEQIAKLLEGLEAKGKIVQARNDVLIRSYLRRNAFATPNMLKAARYAIQHQVTDPLLRTVLATEMLRLDVASIEVKTSSQGSPQNPGRVYAKGRDAFYQAAQAVWTELVEAPLPPAVTMRGSTDEPNGQMLEQILASEDFQESLPQLQRRDWGCVHPQIAAALVGNLGGGSVTPITRTS